MLSLAFHGKPGLRRSTMARIENMDDAGRRELRSRLIAAVQVPAAKVRARHGFRRIVSIRFNPEKGTALVDHFSHYNEILEPLGAAPVKKAAGAALRPSIIADPGR